MPLKVALHTSARLFLKSLREIPKLKVPWGRPPQPGPASLRTAAWPARGPPPDPEGGLSPGPGDPPPRKPRRGGLHPALLSSSWAWRALPSSQVLSGRGSPIGLLAVPFPRTDNGPLPTVVPNPPGGFLVAGQGPIRLLSDSPPHPLASVPPLPPNLSRRRRGGRDWGEPLGWPLA